MPAECCSPAAHEHSIVVTMSSPAVHSYEMDGYQIDGDTIRFALAGPSAGNLHLSVELVFRDVEGYLFERKGEGDAAALSVEEHPLLAFLRANEDFFAREARFGWPRFWQGSADQTEGWLAYRGRRVWRVSTSFGLSGWVVAGSAGYQNAATRSPMAEATSLAAWRLPTAAWRP